VQSTGPQESLAYLSPEESFQRTPYVHSKDCIKAFRRVWEEISSFNILRPRRGEKDPGVSAIDFMRSAQPSSSARTRSW